MPTPAADTQRPRRSGGAEPRPGIAGEVDELSLELRAKTSVLHRQAERLINLPDAIVSCDDYRRWLANFFGFYQPLERMLASFPDWEGLGIQIASRHHSPCIVHDLAALGFNAAQAPQAAAEILPELPTIAHGLGALYVLEGATLGGQVILRAVEQRPGLSIGGARQFFGGRGHALGPMWNEFRGRLDAFGRDHPSRRDDVVAGAQRTFQSLLIWFASLRTDNECNHEW